MRKEGDEGEVEEGLVKSKRSELFQKENKRRRDATSLSKGTQPELWDVRIESKFDSFNRTKLKILPSYTT